MVEFLDTGYKTAILVKTRDGLRSFIKELEAIRSNHGLECSSVVELLLLAKPWV
jgi:hypothetical protein